MSLIAYQPSGAAYCQKDDGTNTTIAAGAGQQAGIVAFLGSGTAPLTELTQSQLIALIPTPAASIPPGVTDSGAAGTTATQYSMGDHTHASKARKGRVAVSTATYTWTFPLAFGAGVVPICNGIAQTASGATDLFNVQIDGAPTNTQVTFRITRYQQSVASLLGLTILSLNATPASITLHMSAFEP